MKVNGTGDVTKMWTATAAVGEAAKIVAPGSVPATRYARGSVMRKRNGADVWMNWKKNDGMVASMGVAQGTTVGIIVVTTGGASGEKAIEVSMSAALVVPAISTGVALLKDTPAVSATMRGVHTKAGLKVVTAALDSGVIRVTAIMTAIVDTSPNIGVVKSTASTERSRVTVHHTGVILKCG
jgi:hypothetical protein